MGAGRQRARERDGHGAAALRAGRRDARADRVRRCEDEGRADALLSSAGAPTIAGLTIGRRARRCCRRSRSRALRLPSASCCLRPARPADRVNSNAAPIDARSSPRCADQRGAAVAGECDGAAEGAVRPTFVAGRAWPAARSTWHRSRVNTQRRSAGPSVSSGSTDDRRGSVGETGDRRSRSCGVARRARSVGRNDLACCAVHGSCRRLYTQTAPVLAVVLGAADERGVAVARQRHGRAEVARTVVSRDRGGMIFRPLRPRRTRCRVNTQAAAGIACADS